MKRVVLDPGHGGRDPGAVGVGIAEKELTLLIARKVRDELKHYAQIEVIMTRDDDVYISLEERAKIANEANVDIFISFHVNAASNTEASGFESYIHPAASEKTRSVQNTIHEAAADVFRRHEIKDRGKKTANFAVLRLTKMPAVLTENGFIGGDIDVLRNPAVVSELAAAYAGAIAAALGVSENAEKTPIAGAAVATVEQALAWARKRRAHERFLSVIQLYYKIAPAYGIRPDVAVAQSAKETAFGRFTGVVPADYHNWCGLKTRAGGGDSDPSAHARFPDDESGVRAHLQHLSAYAGLPLPAGDVIVDPRYALVRRGSASTVEELGGKWAPSPDYGRSIVRDYLLPMIATTADVQAPPFADVSNDHWAADAIRSVVDAGVMNGYGDGTFRPDRPVTRAELAAALANLLTKFNI